MPSRSVNKVLLIGNLGRDAETKYTPSGAPVTRFSVATTRSWKDQQTNEWKEETNWTNVVLWRQENLANYLTKGKQVYVEGRLQTRSYDDKDGKKVYSTEVVADEVILLGGRGEGGAPSGFEGGASSGPSRGTGRPSSAPKAPSGAEEDPFGGMGVNDDDVPF
jgi:single-strand DNA-binding protein